MYQLYFLMNVELADYFKTILGKYCVNKDSQEDTERAPQGSYFLQQYYHKLNFWVSIKRLSVILFAVRSKAVSLVNTC